MSALPQPPMSRNAVRLTLALCAFMVLWSDGSIGQPGGVSDIYTTRAVVTGTDERNRPLGFRLCFEDVLVKVSGDASILSDRRFAALAAVAGQYVSTFSYRDRFEGKPVHDEQGTYDRPDFLTCQFDPQKIDGVLKMLGRKPWLGHRPRLIMILIVHGRTNSGVLSEDGVFDPDMREALANAAQRYGRSVCRVSLPFRTIGSISVPLRAFRPTDCCKSLRCPKGSYPLSATCAGATPRLDGSQSGGSR
jgi:uncharacterized protein